ncbi:MAG: extracellular solute-binding protein [candidate division NC10 bacterium]|nr:extracellular solute-binding protein [candidate division NC10 bacterium]
MLSERSSFGEGGRSHECKLSRGKSPRCVEGGSRRDRRRSGGPPDARRPGPGEAVRRRDAQRGRLHPRPSNHVKELLPEFERNTGIKVNLETQAFPIYNQRADLELSTKGQAYDVLGITYIYAARWIGAGWFFPLDEFVTNRNQTPSEWDAADFDPASMTPLKDAKGKIYGFPWEQSSILMAAARADLLEKAGLKMPGTLKELGGQLPKFTMWMGWRATYHTPRTTGSGCRTSWPSEARCSRTPPTI